MIRINNEKNSKIFIRESLKEIKEVKKKTFTFINFLHIKYFLIHLEYFTIQDIHGSSWTKFR